MCSKTVLGIPVSSWRQLYLALPFRGLFAFRHGFVLVWKGGVSGWFPIHQQHEQTPAGIRLNWATNRSWNSYSFGVPVGFRYQVTSQNNTGQYFKWRNEGFGIGASLEWEISVWNTWNPSNIFDLHGRWAIKCIKHTHTHTHAHSKHVRKISRPRRFPRAGKVTAVDLHLLFSLALLALFSEREKRALLSIDTVSFVVAL